MSGKKKPTYSVKVVEEIDFTESEIEQIEAEVIEVAQPIPSDMTHLVGPKDTWGTIVALYCPKGKSADDYYAEIHALNGKAQLVKGMIVKVA